MSGLPENWEWAVLGDLISSIEAGKSFRCEERPPMGSEPGLVKISAVTKGVFNEYQSKTVLDLGLLDEAARISVGDFLMSRANTIELVGACAIVEKLQRNLFLSDKVLRLRMPDIFKTWVMNWLKTEQGRSEIEDRSSGNQLSMRNIGQESIRSIPVPVPPLPEQRRIVEKIEALTARSRRAREALETLPTLFDRYRQSILAAAFRGDLTADWRLHAECEPISETLKQVPEPAQSRGGKEATETVIPGVGGIAVNDPGSPLPEGWSWVGLRRVARQETGHTPSRAVEDYWDGDISWIGIKDANQHHGKIINDTIQHVTQAGLDNSSARLLPKETVCLSRTASVGYVTIMGKPMATSQDFATWTCTEALDPHYLMYGLLSEGDHIRRFGEGSTHTTIYFPEIRAFHIALAPVAEQKEIVRRIERAFTYLEAVERQHGEASTRLATLDQSILAKAFRGELTPQDPNDEPASVLLERIRAERTAAGAAPRRGRRGGGKASA